MNISILGWNQIVMPKNCTITNWQVSLSKIGHEWPNIAVTHECTKCMSKLQCYLMLRVCWIWDKKIWLHCTLDNTVTCHMYFSVFCYSPRAHIVEKQTSNEPSCAAKDGNPFGPFWDTFEIDFDQSEFYGPLHYDSTNPHEIIRWNKK